MIFTICMNCMNCINSKINSEKIIRFLPRAYDFPNAQSFAQSINRDAWLRLSTQNVKMYLCVPTTVLLGHIDNQRKEKKSTKMISH